jgi:hypothetical protein
MNSAYIKLQRRQARASAALGILGALLLVLVAGAVLVALWHAVAAIPPGWWLPEYARPFGGRWPL